MKWDDFSVDEKNELNELFFKLENANREAAAAQRKAETIRLEIQRRYKMQYTDLLQVFVEWIGSN